MGAFIGRRRRVVLVAIGVMTIGLWGAVPASAVSRRAAVKPAIASGRLHSCALSSGATVVCWGDNSYGQLGNNSTVRSLVPVKVHGVHNSGVLRGVTAITAGNGFSCALLAAGTVDCWGYGGGDLGFGTTGRSLVPVQVHGVHNQGLLTGVTAISAGNGFACALLNTGKVDCWGANGKGQLGNLSTARSLVPVKVHGVRNRGLLSDVTAISAGSSHTPCALLVDGTVDCWGHNSGNKLGDSHVNAGFGLAPVQVHSVADTGYLTGASAISAGEVWSCALLVDGTVDCWGYNTSGALGDNSTVDAARPVPVHGVDDVGYLDL